MAFLFKSDSLTFDFMSNLKDITNSHIAFVVQFFGKCLFIALPKSSSSPFFHARTGKNSKKPTGRGHKRGGESQRKKAKNNYYLLLEQCIIIFATLAFHAMKIYWTLSLHLSFGCVFSIQEKRYLKGFMMKAAKLLCERRRKVFYVLALQDANYGPQLIREIFPPHKRFLGHLFHSEKRFLSFLCVHAKGKKAFKREERTFQNCPK